MQIPHCQEFFETLRQASPEDPLRVLISGCLAGWGCGVDGTDNGMGRALSELEGLGELSFFDCCPEDHSLGTPRKTPDIHGGDGAAVLAGQARVLDEEGEDITEPMLLGAEAMLEFARTHRVELAILTDMSGACGTQVISEGSRFSEPRRYQKGLGVAAARLVESGIPVMSQRDYRSLAQLIQHCESRPPARADGSERPALKDLLDHHQTPWYRSNFSE